MAKLTIAEKQEMAAYIEECIDDALASIEPEQIEEAGEHIKKTVEDHVSYLISMQKMILS